MAKTDMLTARCCMFVVTLLVTEDRLFHLSQFSNMSNRRVDHGDFEQVARDVIMQELHRKVAAKLVPDSAARRLSRVVTA